MSLKFATAVLALLPVAAVAQPALSELSARSRIPETELAQILADCEATQRNMNLCSFHTMITAELRLDALITENNMGTAEEHAAFKAQTREECTDEAEREAGGGSMMPLLITSCMAEVYDNLHDVITTLSGAMPESPPGKWN